MNTIISRNEIEVKLAELEKELMKLEDSLNAKLSKDNDIESKLIDDMKQIDHHVTDIMLCLQTEQSHKKNDRNNIRSSSFSLMATNA
ncbi:hypothetical protein JOC75_000005 [Metabacillus crassostreae]|uniref:hypothetical protein n=1 Tax=Metabacillus crassostreae TaxID=929098 RepID=UPI001957671A|nr:hypothetical protein [Metabacillus crassostreae]MBM7602035.1 hypothetical protein [Metabacillus crassostreae]